MRERRLAFGFIVLAWLPSGAAANDEFSLTLLRSIKIADPSMRFDEPSDLSLDPTSQILWSVSDDTNRIFALGPSGKLDKRRSFDLDANDLEGIAVLGAGELIATKEDTNEILRLKTPSKTTEIGQIVERKELSELEGFNTVEKFFRGDPNKGLEGITTNPANGHVYVIKEGQPRLFIELAPTRNSSDSYSLKDYQIKDYRPLTRDAGFSVPGVDDSKLDVSGITYDPGRDRFWIVSDTGHALFLYDPIKNTGVGVPLNNADGLGSVQNAEGVALNATGEIVYIVTDDRNESLLLTYHLLGPRG